MKKKCYILAGPNGAGKTTFANEFLPIEAECLNFINADLIAQGLSPFQPAKMAIEAGRLMIKRIIDGLVKSPQTVIPAKAGIQNILDLLVSGLRRNDETGVFRLFTVSS